MAEEIKTTEEIFGEVKTTEEVFGTALVELPIDEGIYEGLGSMISGEREVDTLLPIDEKYHYNEIIGAEENDRFANALYLSAQYNINPRLINDTINEISKQKWDSELSQSEIRKRLSEEYTEKLQQHYKTELHPISLFGQAFAQSLATKPAMALRGAQVYTKGEALGLDGLLKQTSDYLEALLDEETKAKVEVAAAGRLWPAYKGEWYKLKPELLPETINAWAAIVGDQIPIMLMTWIGRVVGTTVGKPLGLIAGGTYATATAGPDPHDIVAAPVVAKITEKAIEHLSGATPLIAMEAGGFMDRANSIGLDKDIAEKYARLYGLGSGTIEYAQWLWRLKAFKRVLSPKVQRSILKRVLLEIGGSTWEGIEEMTQGGLENFLIGKAIEEQKKRIPDYDEEKPETWAEAERLFGIGFGVSLITRLPGHVYTSIRKTKLVEQIQQQTDATKEEAKVAVEVMAEGGVVAEQTKKVLQEQVKKEVPAEKVAPVAEGKVAEQIKYAKGVLQNNIFPEGELDYMMGLTDKKPHGIDQSIWKRAAKEIGFTKANLVETSDGGQYYLSEQAKPTPSALERKPAVKEIVPETQIKKLRSQIHAFAAKKGLTKKALTELKKKHTGFSRLTGKIASEKITQAQLEKLLTAVQKARPKRIGYKHVISLKTERKIQSLKENLIKKTAMTEAIFQDVLKKEVFGKEPKYIDAEHFITETQGKDIIKRILDTAEVTRLTESFNKAVENNPEITQQVERLDQKIVAQPKRDPYSLESMRYYNQQAEIKTGAPIFTVYMDLIDTHLENNKTRTATWKRLENSTADFKAITKDKKSLQRVSDYITSQSTLAEKPELPADILESEIALAKEIQAILKEYEIKVRAAKFFNYYYYNQPIPDQTRYAREITKAVDIYESKGREDLIAYLKTQEWGVIHSGYEPMENLFLKIQPYTPPPTAVGKGHIKIRTAIEYHEQERNILQRLASYMRQLDMLFNMTPKINAYVRLFDDNIDKFNKPVRVKENIEFFLRNLKRYNIQRGFFERNIARAYSQAMRVIIMPSPVLSFRNLFQNLAFEHDKTILIDPRNKSLTTKDVEYLETYVIQYRAMVEEYFMVGEQPVLGLKFLTNLIDKIKIYPYSDITNRHWSFWAKKNQVDRALKNKSVTTMMTEAKFNDITPLEQKRALSILAKDGKEAMARYVSRVHVDDIHFLYERAQRSPAETTVMGRVVGNLMLFPRAYGEKLAHATSKMLHGKTLKEQYRGMKILFAVIAGGLVVGAIFKKVTGRRRNPYNPLNIFAFRPGGLAWGSIEAVAEIYANILSAAKGDSRALAALTVAIPEAANMFIPFYDYTLRAIEAATDQKNIDRKALRQIRMLIDKEYKIRGGAYKLERTALEKWQYFIGGAGVDKKIEEKRPKGRRGLGRGIGGRGIKR